MTDFSILTLSIDELNLLITLIEHYSAIHHDRLSSVDAEILYQLYERIYELVSRRS